MKKSANSQGFEPTMQVKWDKNGQLISPNISKPAVLASTKIAKTALVTSDHNFGQWLGYHLGSIGGLAIAIWVSILLHLVVITIKFSTPDPKILKDNQPTLEVMLVNAKTKKASEHADVLAQANLDRGGNTDQNHQLKTALPSPAKTKTEVTLKASPTAKSSAKSAQKQAQEVREQKRIAEAEKQAQALLTQTNSRNKVETLTTKPATSAQPDVGRQQVVSKSFDTAALAAQALEIDRLEALIAKQQDEFQKRPKRKFIGARTQEYRFALYVESWRQKIEKLGNLNYPQAAKDKKLYGQLRMTVAIKADGSLENIEINKSSGSKILDEAARHIVELGAPYAMFPDDIRKDTDILSITRTWTFTQDDNLATE